MVVEQERFDEDGFNAAVERVHRDFLRTQVREIEAIGMGHIPFAVSARRALARYDALLEAKAAGPVPPRRAGDRPGLRLVRDEPA